MFERETPQLPEDSLLRHWQGLSEEQRKKAIPDERLLRVALQEISFLNINNEGDLKTLVDDFEKQNSSSIEHVNELIKIRSRFFGETTPEKFEQLAVKALSQDSQRSAKVYQAANLLRRIRKLGASGV